MLVRFQLRIFLQWWLKITRPFVFISFCRTFCLLPRCIECRAV